MPGDRYYQELLGIKQMPEVGTLDNMQAREWYLYYEAKIPEIIIDKPTLKEQATLAHQLRNWIRTKARELMADRELAVELERTDPNLTLEQVRQRQIEKGLSFGDLAWEGVIRASIRSREIINEELAVVGPPKKTIDPLWAPYVKTPSGWDEAFEGRLKDGNVAGRTPLSHYERLISEERNKRSFAKRESGTRKQREKEVMELEM
ncbi:MAG: hypothetical protein PHV56_08145 [Clostridia bacterium]|nr:hypothetical protein [Clostridia bacterium]